MDHDKNVLDDGPMILDAINYNATENRIASSSIITLENDQSSCYKIC
jgi:hypothetical protein